jgi:hypothetical protein
VVSEPCPEDQHRKNQEATGRSRWVPAFASDNEIWGARGVAPRTNSIRSASPLAAPHRCGRCSAQTRSAKDQTWSLRGPHIPNHLPVNWIAADVLRIKGSILVEHWDVLQDSQSTSRKSVNRRPRLAIQASPQKLSQEPFPTADSCVLVTLELRVTCGAEADAWFVQPHFSELCDL